MRNTRYHDCTCYTSRTDFRHREFSTLPTSSPPRPFILPSTSTPLRHWASKLLVFPSFSSPLRVESWASILLRSSTASSNAGIMLKQDSRCAVRPLVGTSPAVTSDKQDPRAVLKVSIMMLFLFSCPQLRFF